MSLHKSLKLRGTLVRRRNVLTRAERIKRLKAEERWVEGKASVFGLPKVKAVVISAPARAAKKKEKPVAGVPGAEGAAPVAPAPASEAPEKKKKK